VTKQVEPAIGLYWYVDFDPTILPGVAAPLWQLLVRTDNNTLYYKAGLTDTAWILIGAIGPMGPMGPPGAGAIISFGDTNIGASAGARYLDPWNGSVTLIPATLVQMTAPRAGTLRNMRAKHNTSGSGAGAPVVYRFFVNGAPTLLLTPALSTVGAGSASNLVTLVPVVAGDLIACEMVRGAGGGNGLVNAIITAELA
jgi:hypothetical protein